jgi:hypothetical protein
VAPAKLGISPCLLEGLSPNDVEEDSDNRSSQFSGNSRIAGRSEKMHL